MQNLQLANEWLESGKRHLEVAACIYKKVNEFVNRK